jgi:hypothetical protein
MKVCLPLFYTVKFITLNASNIANIIPDSITTASITCAYFQSSFIVYGFVNFLNIIPLYLPRCTGTLYLILLKIDVLFIPNVSVIFHI